MTGVKSQERGLDVPGRGLEDQRRSLEGSRRGLKGMGDGKGIGAPRNESEGVG